MGANHRNFWTASWELISRFTWQLPQTMIGSAYVQVSNYAGQVDDVDYWGGATTFSGNNWGRTSAVTLGSFISGDNSLKADPNNSLFQHEYGHYLQSQAMGLGYLSRVGVPSLMSAFKEDGNHDFQPFEQDANRRAFLYFNRYVEGFYQTKEQYDNGVGITKGWNFYNNPLDINHEAKRGAYYDYNNQNDIKSINNSLTLHAAWYDSVAGAIVGIGNGIYYNNHRVR